MTGNREVSDWRKSSYSVANGQCVEAASGSDMVAVRDTTDRGGTTLVFPAAAWTAFLTLRGRHTCRICGESFNTVDELRFHLQLGHLR